METVAKAKSLEIEETEIAKSGAVIWWSVSMDQVREECIDQLTDL